VSVPYNGQAPAGEADGLEPELLAGSGQVRHGRVVQDGVAGGPVTVVVVACGGVAAGGQAGYLVQARDLRVALLDAAQQVR
jgi:hypothetical protein